MSSEWRTSSFADLINKGALAIGDGYRAKNAELLGDGPLFLRSGRVTDGRIVFDGDERFDSSRLDALAPKLGRPGDTVMTTKGNSTGVAAFVPQHAPVFVYSPHLSYWRACDPTAISAGFLRYWARSTEFKSQLHGFAGSTDMAPYLSLADQRRLRITLPPPAEQRRIAGVLGSLDDKIELNDDICRKLEAVGAMAFEEHVGRCFEGGALAEPLSRIFEIGPPRRLASGSAAPYLEMKNMPTEGHHPLTWTQRRAGSGARFANGDTLIARITPCLENGKAAFVDFLRDGQVGWGSTEYLVLRPRPPIPLEFAYFLVRHEKFRAYAVRHMSGTSGRQRVSAAEIGLFEVPVPNAATFRELGSVLAGVLAAIKARREENRALASIRDVLLPKLVCGELRVSRAYEPDLKSAA